MNIEWASLIIPAITGLLSGAVASLIAPWIHWGIEKRKSNRASQKELIQNVRTLLVNENVTSVEFRNHVVYSQIRSYLPETTRDSVEGKSSEEHETIIIVTGSGRHNGINPFRNEVLDEMTKLEKNWKLI